MTNYEYVLNSSNLFLRGAYSRSEWPKEKLVKAWENGLDFYMVNNRYGYCSIRDKDAILEEYSGIVIIDGFGSHYKVV